MRPEWELLTALCVTPMSAAAVERADSAIARNPDWDLFFKLAYDSDTMPVVATNLSTISNPALIEALIRRATSERLTSRAANIGKVLVISDLLKRFEACGISTMVVKGPATGVTAYDDPSLRNFADLDLLVRPEEISRARDVLIDLDFDPHYERREEPELLRAGHALEFMRPTMKVELHTELLSRYLRVPFDNSSVWHTSRIVRCADTDIRVLSLPVEFVFLLAHGTKHQWVNFRWICDVAQIVARVTAADTQQIIELGTELHCSKLIALGIQLVRDALAVEIPVALERIRASYDTTSLSRQVLRSHHILSPVPPARSKLARIHPAVPDLVFWGRARERWRDRVLPVSDLIFRRR